MTEAKLSRKELVSDQEVRWCPGCGDYSILAQVQRVLPDLGVPREKMVFVSGIGCSSRFPYYMNTYGFHTIHGRAPAIASGLKMAQPDLHVWVITGDGDGLSIGGNHLLHVLRRNVDLTILLFNNQIYGLTKGQYSPTSEVGKKTKSTPYGSIENPLRPLSVALAAGATFAGRSLDRNPKHLQSMLKQASEHRGTSFLEIYQNCNIFNDGAFFDFSEKDVRADGTVELTHGEPLLFGKDKEKGIRLTNMRPEVVNVADVDASELWVHDETRDDPGLAMILDAMRFPTMPVPMGVFRRVSAPTYENQLVNQIEQVTERRGPGDLEALLKQGDTWTVS